MLNSGNCFFATLSFLIRALHSRASNLGGGLSAGHVPPKSFCLQNKTEWGHLPSLEQGQLAPRPFRFAVSLPLKCCVLVRTGVVSQEQDGWAGI